MNSHGVSPPAQRAACVRPTAPAAGAAGCAARRRRAHAANFVVVVGQQLVGALRADSSSAWRTGSAAAEALLRSRCRASTRARRRGPATGRGKRTYGISSARPDARQLLERVGLARALARRDHPGLRPARRVRHEVDEGPRRLELGVAQPHRHDELVRVRPRGRLVADLRQRAEAPLEPLGRAVVADPPRALPDERRLPVLERDVVGVLRDVRRAVALLDHRAQVLHRLHARVGVPRRLRAVLVGQVAAELPQQRLEHEAAREDERRHPVALDALALELLERGLEGLAIRRRLAPDRARPPPARPCCRRGRAGACRAGCRSARPGRRRPATPRARSRTP